MLLENMSYPEVEQYLKNSTTILLPVGSVEQHSPYGIIGTDFIAAEAVAREAAEKLQLLVAPTVSYGVSPHHMNFKGSVTLSPATFIQVISEIILSFTKHGFTRVIIINGHGGNKSSIETAFQHLKMEDTPGQFSCISWYDGLKETQLLQELFQDQDGSHATPSEISLTMLLRPSVFSGKKKDIAMVEKKDYCWPLTADEMERVFVDGRMGAASWLASVEKGRLIMGLAVETLVEKIEKLVSVPLP